MSDSMSESRLVEIEERAKLATPGKWSPKEYEGGHIGVTSDDTTLGYQRKIFTPHVQYDGYGSGGSSRADADFISEARQDIPDLLAEVRRLQKLSEPILEAEQLAEHERLCGEPHGALRILADSPLPEHGGFHPEVVQAAKDAIAFIAKLSGEVRRLRAAQPQSNRELAKKIVYEVISPVAHWGQQSAEFMTAVVERVESVLGSGAATEEWVAGKEKE